MMMMIITKWTYAGELSQRLLDVGNQAELGHLAAKHTRRTCAIGELHRHRHNLHSTSNHIITTYQWLGGESGES